MMADINQNLEQLENKLEALREFSDTHGVDLNKEIKAVEEKLYELKIEAYKNLTPWEKVNLARHGERPTSLDYIDKIFEDFIEFHGDRNFRDDPSIIGCIASLEGKAITVIGHQKGRNTKENIKRNFGMPPS